MRAKALIFSFLASTVSALAQLAVAPGWLPANPIQFGGNLPNTFLKPGRPVGPTSYGDTYAQAYDTLLGGGFVAVSDALELVALPASTMKEGKLAWVKESGHFYQLAHDIITWVDLGPWPMTLTWNSTDFVATISGTGPTNSALALKTDSARTLAAISTPATPSAGTLKFYAKTTNSVAHLFVKTSDGTEHEITPPSSGGGGGDALTTNPLSQFASTTSTQLATVLSNETGSPGLVVFSGGPTITNLVLSGTATGSISGNAATATALATPRTINGTSFDGSANITVTAAAGTLTGSTLSSGVTASSLTSFGTGPVLGDATATTINKLTLTQPASSATLTIANGKTLTANNSLTLAGTDATTLTFPSTSATIARTDAAQTFTGTQTFGAILPSTVNKVTITAPATGSTLTIDDGFTAHVTGNVTALSGSHTGTSSGTNTGDQTSVTGNAGTATALQTARTINGTSFDGTANITVTAAAGTLTGSTLASGVTASSLTSFGTAPALGDATATTASAGNSSTHVATTAFVANSFPRILDKVRTATTVSNSVVETTFYTYTVTGGLLGSSSGVNLKMRGTCFNNNTAAAWTVKVKFGGTVIYSDTTSSQSTSANTRAWSIDLDLVNYASTSIQHGGMNFQLSNSSAPDSGDAAGVSALSDASLTTPVMFAAGSKDTTSNQDLVVTWTNGATGAISGTVEFATLTLIP